MVIFQYCDSNIGVFSVAPHLVIALLTLRQQNLSFLISLLQFLLSFVDWFMASFLYCFPYSYRSSNYCDSNSFRSFALLKALAKSIGNLFAIAFKSDNYRYRDSWKSDNFNTTPFLGCTYHLLREENVLDFSASTSGFY